MIQADFTVRLCLVRHGETPWNAERRLQGHLDVPLNDTGEAQARATAERLAATPFDAVYTSDLLRTRQTAAALESALGQTARPEPGLRERHYGLFQGLTYEEAQQRHPEAYARFHARDPEFAFPDGGESLRGFAARIAATLQRIAAAHQGHTVLAVTHGGVLDVVHRLASGQPLHTRREFGIPNAAINWIGHDGQGWRLISWADESHLSAARDELDNA